MVIFGPVGSRGSIGTCTEFPPPLLELPPVDGVAALAPWKITALICGHFITRLSPISMSPSQSTVRCFPDILVILPFYTAN